jgi:hypothetical protein
MINPPRSNGGLKTPIDERKALPGACARLKTVVPRIAAEPVPAAQRHPRKRQTAEAQHSSG